MAAFPLRAIIVGSGRFETAGMPAQRSVGTGVPKLDDAKPAIMAAFWRSLRKAINDDSMSIMLFSLFLLCLVGQGLSGWLAYNQALRAAHLPAITLIAYLATGNFLDGMLSNWQAAILQLAVLIAF